MVKKAAGTAPAAGSTEPADKGAADPALNSADAKQGVADGTQGGTATIIEQAAPWFPRLVQIINDTPIPYVVAGQYVAGHERVSVAVNDQDEITRMESDCQQIMSLNDTHRDAEEPALRVTEVE
jgi:hypothetical protein